MSDNLTNSATNPTPHNTCSVNKPSIYEESGVNIDAGSSAVKLMSSHARSTFNEHTLSQLGSFGGLYSAKELAKMKEAVLVSSTDGVGTKVKLASQSGIYHTVGQDIVNHCIDDILVQGARPLFFLDYFATNKLDPQIASEVVRGMSIACKESGCVLIGGETAEMPDVYLKGEFDVAGTIIGVVEKDAILPKPSIKKGDILLGLKSASPHTNGYSLIRKAFEGVDLNTVFPELNKPLSDVLLTPHRSYLHVIHPILQKEPDLIKGIAHITGGGFPENIPRVLPKREGNVQLVAKVNTSSWKVPPLYSLIEKRLSDMGLSIEKEEMYRVFNMGIAFILIVEKEKVSHLQSLIPEETYVIGEIDEDEALESPITRLIL